ncbi:MAG TPA: VOC family protein [Candidatus Acidoferrales bacterium]|nr:VOC family protein [Candidatus Acidoferrales bacterium]
MKSTILGLALAALLAPFAQSSPKENSAMNVKRITPVLYVEEIEPCLPFWVDRLGFQKTAEVPDGGKLAFVALQKGATEIMYQTFASQEKELPGWSKQFRGSTFLFIEVDKLSSVITAMKGVKVEVPERNTPYSSHEVGYKDPAGHVVLFAEFPGAQH